MTNENNNQPEKFDLSSMDISAEKRAELLRLFPEARTEGGKIDFDLLKLAVGGTIDVGKERYGLTWPGKANCFKTVQAPSRATLRPVPEESVNWDTTENLIIEGDNLEALRLLQKSYLGKVKMIYIDPPYNTGNDFIYPDDYSETIQTYLEYTGQIDSSGRKFGTNVDTEGRFHSKWLNLMYPRLYLARNLLSDDGVVFISINDVEIVNLRAVADFVFGEENFIGSLIWKSRHNVDSRNKTGLSSDHEYIVCYGKRLSGSAIDETKYSNPDADPRGPWMSDNMVGLATREQRPNLHYDLENPETKIVYACPEKGWRYDRNTMAKKIAERRILWPSSSEGRPRHKKFLNELRSKQTGFSSILDAPNTAMGTQEIRSIFGEAVFDFPKPVGLLKTLIKQSTSAEGENICLDFFAGSGATAQAVLELNEEDGGERRFILIQLPEPTHSKGDDGAVVESAASKAGYRTISEITKERVRRVISNMTSERNTKLLGSQSGPDKLGFRVFKLSDSNFTTWDAADSQDAESLGKQLAMHIDHIRHGRSDVDILFELLLKSGFPLTTPVQMLTLAAKSVYSIGEGVFLVCLDRKLTLEVIRAMADLKPSRIVCLDVGFAGNDQLKVNAVQTFKTKGVAKFQTV